MTYRELQREHNLTPKMASLLVYFATEVGKHSARRLGQGNARTGVGLCNRGLLNRAWGGRYGSQNDWWVTEKGYELGLVLSEARRSDRRKQPAAEATT